MSQRSQSHDTVYERQSQNSQTTSQESHFLSKVIIRRRNKYKNKAPNRVEQN